MPADRYAGVPARDQQRPTVPRAVRRANAAAARESKENMCRRAEEAYAHFSRTITDIAIDTGYPRSVVARTANDGGKQAPKRRDVNVKNAWISKRMVEVNKGMVYIFILD